MHLNLSRQHPALNSFIHFKSFVVLSYCLNSRPYLLQLLISCKVLAFIQIDLYLRLVV